MFRAPSPTRPLGRDRGGHRRHPVSLTGLLHRSIRSAVRSGAPSCGSALDLPSIDDDRRPMDPCPRHHPFPSRRREPWSRDESVGSASSIRMRVDQWGRGGRYDRRNRGRTRNGEPRTVSRGPSSHDCVGGESIGLDTYTEPGPSVLPALLTTLRIGRSESRHAKGHARSTRPRRRRRTPRDRRIALLLIRPRTGRASDAYGGQARSGGASRHATPGSRTGPRTPR